MKTLLVLCFLAQLRYLNCLDSSLEDVDSSIRIPTIKIERVKSHGERKYSIVTTRIHDDFKRFDLYVQMIRELRSNNLVMNLNMRAKFDGEDDFKRIFEMKRMDFCGWLTEYKENIFLRSFFKKSMEVSDIIVCPVRVGNYSLTNVNVADNVYPENLVPGSYKYFMEIAEVNGDTPKIFAMQVTTKIYFQ